VVQSGAHKDQPLTSPATPEALTTVLRGNVRKTVFASLETLGRLVALAIGAVRGTFADIITLRFQWNETTRQAWYLITVTAIPAILMAIPFGVVVSVQVGNLIKQLGADSLLGAAGGLGVIQQGAPLATGLLLGGAGAATIAADLGARALLNILIIFVGVLSGYAVAIGVQGVTPGSYWATFGSFASLTDVAISTAKALIFGFIVVVIGCQRGLEAKGGPRGVADGVNASVVLSVVLVTLVNVGVTQLVAMFYPTKVA
jgi:phospholipid/cholesterol/gamma-HCH transport system permease protein